MIVGRSKGRALNPPLNPALNPTLNPTLNFDNNGPRKFVMPSLLS
jgi:hypothetical protein